MNIENSKTLKNITKHKSKVKKKEYEKKISHTSLQK